MMATHDRSEIALLVAAVEGRRDADRAPLNLLIDAARRRSTRRVTLRWLKHVTQRSQQ
jgi:hypothetical protein